jgi:Tfp pilus assembly PilM family ATPase
MTTLLDRTYISVEFKEDNILIACLKNDLSGERLLFSSTFPWVDDDKNISDIKSSISPYMRKDGSVFVSIPYKWALVGFIDVPSPRGKGRDAVLNMMRYEIEKHIPFPIEDVFYDFQVIERGETTYKIVFASVPKERIEQVRSFLERLSLNPRIITLSPFAVLNSIGFSGVMLGGWQGFLGFAKRPEVFGGKDELCAVLLLDRDESYISVLKGGSCIYLSSVDVDYNQSLNMVIDKISSEFSLLDIEDSKEINKLIISGSLSTISDLSSAIEERLGLNVQTINPVSKFFSGSNIMAGYEFASSIGVYYMGMGMGIAGINLLPEKASVPVRKIGPVVTVICLFLIIFLTIGIFAGELVGDRRLLGKIEKRLKENEPQIRAIEGLSADLNSLMERKSFLLSEKQGDILLDVLFELTSIIPADAWLTNFDYRRIHDKERSKLIGEIIISGQAVSSSTLISLLEDSPLFEKVEFVGPITKRGVKEGFKIKAMVVKSPRIQT